MGGEESGGIGTKLYLPERDATVTALLLAEVMAWHGKSLGELVQSLYAEFGEHHYGRVDLDVNPAKKKAPSPTSPMASATNSSICPSPAAKTSTASKSISAKSAGSWFALRAPKICCASIPKPTRKRQPHALNAVVAAVHGL